jgi:hypothetical protein
MRETIGGKNSQPKQRRKKRGSNLDVSARRKKRNKLKRANSLSSSLQPFKSIPPPPSSPTPEPTLHTISSGTDSEYSMSDDEMLESDDEIDYYSRRIAIYYYYTQVLKYPEKSQWNESATIIKESLQLPSTTRQEHLHRLFKAFDELKAKDEEYDGKRLINIKKDKRIIETNSTEAQIIADAYEDGFSIKATTQIVNMYLLDKNIPFVTCSAVYGLIKRLNPKISAVEKAKQGSSDPNSNWAKARVCWISQLLVRFGILRPPNPPPYLDHTKMPPLSLYQIAWWDEKHRKVIVSSGLGKTTQAQFRRNAEGKLDPLGEYGDKKSTLHMKFAEEVRFCFGVAMIKNNGIDEGVRLAPFEYTGKTVVLHKKFMELVKEEIKRVKNLPGNTAPWYISTRPPKSVYLTDPTSFIKGVGKKKAEKLAAAGIHTVADILNSPTVPDDFTERAWLSIKSSIPPSVPPSPPSPINHKLADNPYLSLYGDSWLSKIKTVTALSSYCDIQDMVTHIYNETKKLYMGSPYEKNFYFYHDALSQMNNSDTIEWMKLQGYLKHWILPMNGCNEGTTYDNHPVGNTPEIMPLDTSLFNDLDEAIQRHIIYTNRLDPTDPKKFSLSTPSRASSAYRRVWEGAPSSKRIIQDISKLTFNMSSIVQHKGCVVPGLGNRGNRFISSTDKSKRGGKRIRYNEVKKAHWMHEDTDGCTSRLIEDAVLKVEKVEKKEYICKKDVVEKEEGKEEVKEKVIESQKVLEKVTKWEPQK